MTRAGIGASSTSYPAALRRRTRTLVEVDEVTVPVPQELHLDMLGPADELLEKDVGDPERRPGLTIWWTGHNGWLIRSGNIL